MIVLPLAAPPAGSSAQQSDRLLVVNQIDHAAFAGELLSLWRSDGMPENPRRQALVRGARQHDNGWAEADSAPRRRLDGRPHDFRSMPAEVRLEIWRRAVRRYADSDPEAAVYVARHAIELHRDEAGQKAGQETWCEAVASWRELEDELRLQLDLTEDDLAGDYRFLRVADTASLAACLRWTAPVTDRGVTMRTDPEDDLRVNLLLDPFPLAGATTFKIRSRTIPDRVYRGDADLAVALASARWQDLVVRVTPTS